MHQDPTEGTLPDSPPRPDPIQDRVRLCEKLFAQTLHVHGLTKTCRPLIELCLRLKAKRLTDRRQIEAALKRLDPGLTRWKHPIAGEAVRFAALSREEGVQEDGMKEPVPSGSRSVAIRLAALLQLGDAVARLLQPGLRLDGVVDEADGLILHLFDERPFPSLDASRLPEHAWIWNEKMSRPILSVRIVTSEGKGSDFTQPDAPVSEVLRRILLRQLEQFTSRAHGLSCREDIEVVHEMRVALRRMRASVRTFKRASGEGVDNLRRRASDLALRLGPVRDLDVFLLFLREVEDQAIEGHRPHLQRLIRAEQGRRRRGYALLVSAFQSEEYAAFVQEFRQLLTQGSAAGMSFASGRKSCREPIRSVARGLLSERLDEVTHFPRRLDRCGPDEVHRLRIACKRLRYAAEFLSWLYPDGLADLIGTMTSLQDALGDVHDGDIYTERITCYLRRCQGLDDRDRLSAFDALIGGVHRRRGESLQQAQTAWMAFRREESVHRIAEILDCPRGD